MEQINELEQRRIDWVVETTHYQALAQILEEEIVGKIPEPGIADIILSFSKVAKELEVASRNNKDRFVNDEWYKDFHSPLLATFGRLSSLEEMIQNPIT